MEPAPPGPTTDSATPSPTDHPTEPALEPAAATWPTGPTADRPTDPAIPPTATDTAAGPTTVLPAEPTPTGPSTAGWPLEDLLADSPAPSAAHRTRPPPEPAPPRRPVYYVSLTVAVMLVLGLVTGLAVLSANPPVSRVAGAPLGLNIPDLPSPTRSTPPGATTTTTTTTTTPTGAFAELAGHPLSTSTATMPESTCSLPMFAPEDGTQAAFHEASKACADAAFGGLFAAAGFDTVPVEVRTVTDTPVQSPCGEIEPATPSTQCAGTVYMTAAHLRDVEGNGRFPGRYFGVFLREYARALQEAAGFPDLYATAKSAGAGEEDVAARASQQAICLAGIAAGAMADRGSVDGNIYTEIGQRLTEVDAPPAAADWLDRGAGTRQLSACNSWAEP
jgi:hypothetical protein